MFKVRVTKPGNLPAAGAVVRVGAAGSPTGDRTTLATDELGEAVFDLPGGAAYDVWADAYDAWPPRCLRATPEEGGAVEVGLGDSN